MGAYSSKDLERMTLEQLAEIGVGSIPGSETSHGAQFEINRRVAESQLEAAQATVEAAEYTRQAAQATIETAKYTRQNARYMLWSVIALVVTSTLAIVAQAMIQALF